MTILGLDAALGGFSAAVLRDEKELASIDLPGNVALEQGLAAVVTVMRRAGVTPGDLGRIAVGIGPGSFTGVRIAISFAKSLAQGWGKPLVGVSSFDAIEAGVALDSQYPLLNAVQGRPGVVSVRVRAHGKERRTSGYVRDVLAEVREALGNGSIAFLGDAKDVLAALGERQTHLLMYGSVMKPAALAVAYVATRREPAPSLHEVRADYGELPAAKVPKT